MGNPGTLSSLLRGKKCTVPHRKAGESALHISTFSGHLGCKTMRAETERCTCAESQNVLGSPVSRIRFECRVGIFSVDIIEVNTSRRRIRSRICCCVMIKSRLSHLCFCFHTQYVAERILAFPRVRGPGCAHGQEFWFKEQGLYCAWQGRFATAVSWGQDSDTLAVQAAGIQCP